MTIAYDITTAAVAGTMVGNEVAIAAFVHPQLWRADDKIHSYVASSLAAVLGRVMPFWYGLALVLMVGASFEHRPILGEQGVLLVSAAVMWAATIVFTISTLVPINDRIAKMDCGKPYDGWLRDRTRWDALHRVRVGLLIIALFFLLAGLFGGTAIS